MISYLQVSSTEVERAFETSIKATVQAINKHVDGQENVVRFPVTTQMSHHLMQSPARISVHISRWRICSKSMGI